MAQVLSNDSSAITVTIKASSRISLKEGESFYTVEYTEERTVPENCNLEKERAMLWDTVNTEVDNQALEIHKLCKK